MLLSLFLSINCLDSISFTYSSKDSKLNLAINGQYISFKKKEYALGSLNDASSFQFIPYSGLQGILIDENGECLENKDQKFILSSCKKKIEEDLPLDVSFLFGLESIE